MKKLVISLLALVSLSFASTYKYEITPTIGGVLPEGNLDIKDHINYGLRFGINIDKIFDQIELGYERSDGVKYIGSNLNTDINRYFVNLIKYYPIEPKWSLYSLVGLGYENMKTPFAGNGDSGFFNYGLGMKYEVNDNFSLRGELRHAINFKHADNKLFYTVGFSIPFGKVQSDKADTYKPKPIAKEDLAEKSSTIVPPIAVLDDDKDGVSNNLDLCPNTPMGAKVDEKGCELDGDHDGVVNSKDDCLNTPAGNMVDANGCEKIIHLRVKFAFDKTTIPQNFMGKINDVAHFMSINKNYKVILEGNTDSTGTKKYNQKLSIKRAKAVEAELEKLNVSSDRIMIKGLGESNPIANNKTKEGRSENRRVDTKFNKN